MISSLANFLMLILYQGGFSQRVAWTLLMYTMGAVCVARIAIEQDRTYSIGYAAALALAAFVVLVRFAPGSFIFCAGILALIAYLSDRIVHDCTLIDDNIDASGQGLIEFGKGELQRQLAKPDAENSDAENSDAEKLAATNSDSESSADQPTSLPKRKHHQPGRTVMYLAVGALPLFGIGQFLLRSDMGTWGTAQKYLAVYLFSSLSLLVTTSFLGLRRYLRQRKVDMPGDVTVAWLAGGLGMIAIILTIAYLAPMPGQLLASIKVPDFLSSPKETSSSSMGWGDEAANQSDSDAQSTPNDQKPEGKEIQSIRPQEGAPPGDSGDGKGKEGPSGKQEGAKKGAAGKKPSPSGQQKSPDGPKTKPNQSESKQSKSQSPESQSPKSQQPESQQPPKQQQSSASKAQETKPKNSANQPSEKSKESSKSDPAKPDSSNPEASDPDASQKKPTEDQKDSSQQQDAQENEADQQRKDSPSDSEQQPDSDKQTDSNQQSDNKQQTDSNQQSDAENQPSNSGSSTSQTIGNLFSAIGGLIRFVIMAALFVVVGLFVYWYREAIALWWASLWNRDTPAAAPELPEQLVREIEQPPRPFSTFRNPVGNEKDSRRIVVVTFQAFEAWTREQGWQRDKNETPSEFMRRVASSIPGAASPAAQIVDAYNRIVYGRGKATQQDIHAAEKVWQAMQA